MGRTKIETPTSLWNTINGATEKTTPVDADMVWLVDSQAWNILKKLSWANIKATLKTYFDTLYVTIVWDQTITWIKTIANNDIIIDRTSWAKWINFKWWVSNNYIRYDWTHIYIQFASWVINWFTNYGSIWFATFPDNSAALDLSSTVRWFLPPRMTTTQKNAISSPATGLMVYDTTLNKLSVRTPTGWQTVTSV